MIRIARHKQLGVLVTTSTEDVPRDNIFVLQSFDFAGVIHSPNPAELVRWLLKSATAIKPSQINGWDILDGTLWRKNTVPAEYENYFAAPVFDPRTEIKGVGVTYKGSRDFREAAKQSGNSGAGTVWGQPLQLSDGSPIAYTVARPYDYVYQAPEPEIFEKAVGIQEHRIAGPGHYIGLRTDSVLMVNEGEIGFLIDYLGRILGHFMGNDFTDSHRESENMLYLPEAKGFDRCVSLGPWIALLDEPIALDDPRNPLPLDTRLTLVSYDHRDGSEYERGTYTLSEMQRVPQELAWWATYNHSYPAGLMLLCGTGHAKGQRLSEHHVVHIHREGLGTLVTPTKRLVDNRPRPASVGKRTFTL